MSYERKRKERRDNIALLVIAFILLVTALLSTCHPVEADTIPHQAKQYRGVLIRSIHAYWGLDAPVATMAAQVHQESRWQADARSPVGALGIAQFMPGTAQWMSELYPVALPQVQPYNPGWSLRAMVLYNRWLFQRNHARSPCDHWAMVLSAYNGGQGWVNRDRRLALASGASELAWFNNIERFNAGRSQANFSENRHYPRIILGRWEPLYVAHGWGRGVCEGLTF